MANSRDEGNAFATPRSSTWIVLNCILFVILLDSCCWWLDKGVSRVFKGQTGFEFRVLCFRVLGASFSRFECFVFEIWVLRFRVLGASFSSLGCFIFESWVLRFRDLGASCFSLCFRVLRFRNYRTLHLGRSQGLCWQGIKSSILGLVEGWKMGIIWRYYCWHVCYKGGGGTLGIFGWGSIHIYK